MSDLPYHKFADFLSISLGLRPTHSQVLLFVVILGSLLILLFSGYLVQSLARKRRKREHVEKVFANMMHRGNFSDDNRSDEIGRQAWNGTTRIHTSCELPLGLDIQIVQWEGKKLSGKIFYQRPDVMGVKADGNGAIFELNTPVLVSFKHDNGIYSFGSRVAFADGQIVGLVHAEKIAHMQNRKFYRIKISQPVSIKISNCNEPVFETMLLDLSAGGASIANPEALLQCGTELVLTLPLSQEERVIVPCEVVRLSDNDQIAHLFFKFASNQSREKIVHYIFALRN